MDSRDGRTDGRTDGRSSDLRGRRLGAFVVGDELGEGGMGAVYSGRDVALDRPVAIKVLHAKLARDAEFVDRFVREARTAARLNHPNIVQIYGAGYEDGVAYMALELVTGCSLFELYRRRRPFPPRRACELVRDVAAGLGVAHDLGVVHRDIKPENILVSEAGVPKLADFGLARSTDQRITETGVFLGTPQYASPEQCNAAELTAASDLYSLGVVLYELLAGRPPYEAPTPLTLFKKILLELPAPLAERCPDLPPSLHAIVARLLEKDPERRYARADELARDLERVLQRLPEPEADQDPFAGIEGVAGAGAVTVIGAGDSSVIPFAESTAAPIALPSATAAREIVAAAAEAPAQEPPLAALPPDAAGARRAVFGLATLAAALLLSIGSVTAYRAVHREAPRPSPSLPRHLPVAGPVSVAVLPWANGAEKQDDFRWLADAVPQFVQAQLGQRSGRVAVTSPLKVAKALGAGIDLGSVTERHRIREAVGATMVVSGRFYAEGPNVGVLVRVEDAEGNEVSVPGNPAVFAKDDVLQALKDLAGRVALAVAGPETHTDTKTTGAGPELASASSAKLAPAAAPAPAALAQAPAPAAEPEPRPEAKPADQEGLQSDPAVGGARPGRHAGQGGAPASLPPSPAESGAAKPHQETSGDAPSERLDAFGKENAEREARLKKQAKQDLRAAGPAQDKGKDEDRRRQDAAGKRQSGANEADGAAPSQPAPPTLRERIEAAAKSPWQLMALKQDCMSCEDEATHQRLAEILAGFAGSPPIDAFRRELEARHGR